jgi:hypothetical protein
MSKKIPVMTKNQLMQQISMLVDEYVCNAIDKKSDIEFVVDGVDNVDDVNCHQNSEYDENNNNDIETILPSIEEDDICMAYLTNGTRCSRDRYTQGSDVELCKYHNNPRFEGRIIKITRKGSVQTKQNKEAEEKPSVEVEEPEERSQEQGDAEEEAEDVQEIFITEDEDGHMVDSNGSIWDVVSKTIIGRKDLTTKQKLFFKRL